MLANSSVTARPASYRIIVPLWALILCVALQAHAGGLGRPNIFGAPAVGMGGAFAPVADDPTAIWHNPAGISLIPETSFLLDAGLLFSQRSYEPLGCDFTAPHLPPCAEGVTTRRTEKEMLSPTLFPGVAFSTRFGGKGGDGATRLAVGFATFVSHGMAAYFSEKLSMKDRPGVRSLRVHLLEIVPAVAYQASDVMAVGAGLRIGVGMFGLNAPLLHDSGISDPVKVATTGVSAGVSLGILLRPLRSLDVAFVYQSALNVPTSGDIDIESGSPMHASVDVKLPFPQQVFLGVGYRPIRPLRLAAQVDFTNSRSFDRFKMEYASTSTELYLDLNDTWTVHVGGEYRIGENMVARLGYAFETRLVPMQTAERYLVDGLKHTVAGGFGYAITREIRIDAALEYLFIAPERRVPMSLPEAPELLRHVAPGIYRGGAYQALVTAQYRY